MFAKYLKPITAILVLTTVIACNNEKKNNDKTGSMIKVSAISKEIVDKTIKELTAQHGDALKDRIVRGVNQCAAFWFDSDGNDSVFVDFCKKNFVADEAQREKLFERLSRNFEILWGNFNRIHLALKEPLDLDMGEILPVDEAFGAYDPGAHLQDDLFNNKTAFIIILNFPFYSLKEKEANAARWTRKDWAYARMGDIFISRTPSDLLQKILEVNTAADTYIADYNIYMGNLIDEKGTQLFPKEMKLITHWGLRDELKANYGNKENGLAKQKTIYEVMKHIILQDIPQEVINSEQYQWNPFTNKIFKNGAEQKANPETDVRYKHLLANFKVLKEADAYNPSYPTYIQRAFDASMEISQEEVEKMFIRFLTSPQVKQVAQLISKRLGRNLQPFDIWYDGFKARSTISEAELSAKTKAKYPNKEAFAKDLPVILTKLGWTKEKAEYIASKIAVDASRGAGHAWQSESRDDKAHLRTRIGKDGMDYKGYNIAIHEFGHNVEQTLTLYDMDYYMLRGVPNTAFTEALAFIFQKRDLELLDIKNNDPNKEHLMTLDNFWASYEIMGVSLVDMYVWKWLYEHPDATASQLKEQVIATAKDVWNKYYAPVFGSKDEPILAIYSHMISNPLYLSAYPVGHIIDFQIEKQIKGKKFSDEVMRMYKTGRVIPQLWMKEAVGKEISIDPMLEATQEALGVIKE